MQKKLVILFFIGLFLVVGFKLAAAQEQASEENQGLVDYGDALIIDKDLDGLTDQGEEQIFLTDPQLADTDGDGILDGAEVLGGTDPNSILFPSAEKVIVRESQIERGETPWAWYLTRSAGLIALGLLYLSVLFGLLIRVTPLSSLIGPRLTNDLHCFIAKSALLWALVHGLALLFDQYTGFGFLDVFVPFWADWQKIWVGLGVIAFYLIALLTVTSYFRSRLNYKLWRVIHYLSPVLYVFSILHAWVIGADFKTPLLKGVVIGANLVLVMILIVHLVYRFMRRRRQMV